MRRRAAQGRCATLALHERDEAREARLFEPVVAALDDITPRVEVTRPGTCALVMRGPSRHFGGDAAVADLVHERLAEVVAERTDVRVGVADGPFAAELAARAANPTRLVPSGEVAGFLAPMKVDVLERPELVDVLPVSGCARSERSPTCRRPTSSLVSAPTVSAPIALRAGDERPPDARRPPVDWTVSNEIDPPADRVDRVAFLARTLADELHRRLGRDGVTCVRVGIEAETEHGEQLLRFWRHEGTLSDAAVADRVRWQLDGWLNGSAASRPSGGITRLALIPDELIAAKGRQLGFWGGETEVDQRAIRVAARLQGQLGADAVLVPERKAARHPDSQLRLVPAATVELTGRSSTPNLTPHRGPVCFRRRRPPESWPADPDRGARRVQPPSSSPDAGCCRHRHSYSPLVANGSRCGTGPGRGRSTNAGGIPKPIPVRLVSRWSPSTVGRTSSPSPMGRGRSLPSGLGGLLACSSRTFRMSSERAVMTEIVSVNPTT